MAPALRKGDGRDRQREQKLNRKLEARWDAERADTQLALVIREADDTARNDSAHRGQHSTVPRKGCQQPANDAERREDDAASRRGAGLTLMGLGQLGLDDLS